MSLVGFKAQNHRQQVGRRGPNPTVDDRGTDPVMFAEWDQRFGFPIDVAAAAHNAKCARHFTITDDGLAQSWAGERVWCNPPYSNIAPWVEKGWLEHETADLIVMLLPANRTEQGWWMDMVEPYRDRAGSALHVEFLRGRLRFVRAGAVEIGPNERPPFGCCLLIWNQQ
jgi:phage N-6-adenine-methyltransferase